MNTEFTVYTDRGIIKVAAATQEEANSIAKKDGYRIVECPDCQHYYWQCQICKKVF